MDVVGEIKLTVKVEIMVVGDVLRVLRVGNKCCNSSNSSRNRKACMEHSQSDDIWYIDRIWNINRIRSTNNNDPDAIVEG